MLRGLFSFFSVLNFATRKPSHNFVITKNVRIMKLKHTIFLSSVILATLSCRHGVTPEVPVFEDDGGYEFSHEMIVLGDRLEDPYALDNMSAALQSLYPTKARRIDLAPTDVYVRILPSSEEEYDMLDSLGVMMIDHPLDHKILKDGDYYHDPSIPEDCITWQYAVVKSNFSFPDGIRYEKIDDCYIVDTGSTPTRSDDGIDWAAVERESFRLTGNSQMILPETRAGSAHPSGTVRIVDDELGETGVAGVMVCVNSFVKIATTYTDAEGAYSIDRNFNSDIRYRLVFKNQKGFGIGFNMLLVPASTSTLGKHGPEGYDVLVDATSDRKLFSRCVVNNAAWDYFSMCEEELSGIAAPPSNLRMWLFQKLSSSSSPMLQHGAVLDKVLFSKYLSVYADIIKSFLPDITLGLEGADDYKSIYGAAMHELAHASHWAAVGNDWWNSYILYVVKSFVSTLGKVYGSGAESGAGYCEVGEMWGYYMHNSMLARRYGPQNYVYGTSWWFSPQIFMYMEDRGLTAGRIFPSLTAEVNDLVTLQDALINNCPEYAGMIRQAFERYDH